MADSIGRRKIQIDKIAEKMTKKTEEELVRQYKMSLRNIKRQMADIYERYEINGELTFAEMTRYNRIAGLWDNINKELVLMTDHNSEQIRRLSGDVFGESFYRSGFMFEEALRADLNYSLLNPMVIQASVENPISGLTLNEILEKNRTNIIRDVKQTITQGLIQGNSYSKMARRLTTTFEGDLAKANRVVRTEVHRNKEAGSLAAGEHARELGVKFSVVWMSTLDARTRDQHGSMDGQVAKEVDGKTWEFTFPDGIKTPAPGMSGYAHHDINCRCTTRKRPTGFETPSMRRIRGEGLTEYKTYDQWAEEKGIKRK